MTAPQHDAKAIADQANPPKKEDPSPSSYSQKLQRCWFITLGLLGGFGFIASQMNLAMAETEFLITDYAVDSANSDYATGSYTVPDTTFTANQAEFEVAPVTEPAPVPEAFVEAPSTAAAIAAIQLPAPAVVQPPVPAVQPAAASVVSAPVVAAPTSPAVSPAASPTGAIIEFEITPAAVSSVTPVRPPSFTAVQKPVASKVASRTHPMMGLIEASAVAAPLSAYAIDATSASGSERALLMANQGGLEAEALRPEVAVTPESEVVPDILPEPVQAAPEIVEVAPPVIENAVPIQPTEIIPAAVPESINLPEEYNSVFVDPTDYSVGATETTQTPDVVISEQSTGCEFTVGQSQAVPNGACGTGLPSAPAPVAEAGYQEAPVAASQAAPEYNAQYNAQAEAPVASAPTVNVGPVSFSPSGIQLSTSAAGRAYINRSVRPLVSLQAAQDFIFPLSIPSPITSLFGFRLHPITGDQRFHAGTDIGAAQGTPVLAAQDGIVAAASSAGGYGLMVVLQHEVEETQLESRYAHLAEIFVQAGKDVKKGDVIGLVGSTGNSTGPHLHFEMRQMTADGWVLVNADGLVQSSLANLVKALNSPMQAMSFNLSDFNLSNLRANGSIRAVPSASDSSASPLLPGQDGIPFRPAQPNAS